MLHRWESASSMFCDLFLQLQQMKGGSYDDVPNPKNTVVTVPGEGTMTEEEWHKSVDDALVRNGYAGVGGKRSTKKRSTKKRSAKRRGSLKKRHPTRRRRS